LARDGGILVTGDLVFAHPIEPLAIRRSKRGGQIGLPLELIEAKISVSRA